MNGFPALKTHRLVSRAVRLAILVSLAASLAASAAAGTDVWCTHVTAAAGWKTSVSIYNSGATDQGFLYSKYNENGVLLTGPVLGVAAARSWTLMSPASLQYEGSLHLWGDGNLLVKVNYQFGDSPSVCEFNLDGEMRTRWVLPNTARTWMEYTGLSIFSVAGAYQEIRAEAWKNGQKVATTDVSFPEARQKYVRLSNQVWTGVDYDDFDTVVVSSATPFPAPLSITGNGAQDRHLFFAALPEPGAAGQTDAWVGHVTAAAGWHTRVQVYNAGSSSVGYKYYRYDENGAPVGSYHAATVPARSWEEIPSADLDYEGSLRVLSAFELLVKLSYQYMDTPSMCEFYLTGDQHALYTLPNSARSWMDWTGLALLNPSPDPVDVDLVAFKNGSTVGVNSLSLAPGGKYVRLSNGIWDGVDYADFDTIQILSAAPLPAPISITGNDAQDRHLFFAGRQRPPNDTGDVVDVDADLGVLRFVRQGQFTQGSGIMEACRESDEPQFDHRLTRDLAVMDTEVTREMWAALKAVQPSLPDDPSSVWLIPGANLPVNKASWHQAVLFANLLSEARGLPPCYFKDAWHLIPVDSTNYTSGNFYCDFDADGYRLPTEGEWEYVCRSGTESAFNVLSGGYNLSNCGQASTPGLYPGLDAVAWFEATADGRTHPVGGKDGSPWMLYDLHGNVYEWCWDLYAAYPTTGQLDYANSDSGTTRVLRGGSWDSPARHLRSAARASNLPTAQLNINGFRLVRTIP